MLLQKPQPKQEKICKKIIKNGRMKKIGKIIKRTNKVRQYNILQHSNNINIVQIGDIVNGHEIALDKLISL